MPSSLGSNHSFVLVFSTLPPVLVCGTVSVQLCLEAFLGSALLRIAIGQARSLSALLGVCGARICLSTHLTARTTSQYVAHSTALRPSFALQRGDGILTICPSGPPFGIPLGPTNPQLITIAEETLGFQRAGISPALRLLAPAFSLLYAPPWVPPLASSQNRTLSYHLVASF